MPPEEPSQLWKLDGLLVPPDLPQGHGARPVHVSLLDSSIAAFPPADLRAV